MGARFLLLTVFAIFSLTAKADTNRVLVIGDSHTVQSFGRNLDEMLRAQPETNVALHASWGSHPYSWLTGARTKRYLKHEVTGPIIDVDRLDEPGKPMIEIPTIDSLLTDLKPTSVIIALGANIYLADPNYAFATTRALAEKVNKAGALCLWIGFPSSRIHVDPEASRLYLTLKNATDGYCELFDSRRWARYPDKGGDGLHFDYLGEEGFRITKIWANAVFEAWRNAQTPFILIPF